MLAMLPARTTTITIRPAMRQSLIDDRQMRDFFEGDTNRVPDAMAARVQRDLGHFWELLPADALSPMDEVRPGAVAVRPTA